MSAPLLDNLARRRNNRVILEDANSFGVCYFCHADHVSISPSSLQGSQGLSHAGANGLGRKSSTFSVLSHNELTGEGSWGSAPSALRSSERDASVKSRSRGSSLLIEWASRRQEPQRTSSTESESFEWGRAATAMLRVKEELGCLSSETSAL